MSNGKKASHLLDQEDSRETSKPLRRSMHCWTFFHLVSPMCAWLASWRSPSKICTLGIHLDYRFSIWHSSVRCEVFLNHFPEKKNCKRYRQECICLFTILRVPLTSVGTLPWFNCLLTWPCYLASACIFIQ